MRFTLEIDKKKLISSLEENLRKFIIFIYGWLTTDGKILGYILGVTHFLTAIAIFIVLIVSYTIYPAFWLQSLVISLLFIIWLQHVVLKVCISTVAEETFTNSQAPFFRIVTDLTNYFGISFDRFLENIVIAETIAISSLSLALIGRISVNIHDIYNIPY
jgi:hypothetical protein